jgi:hypothetical protein
MRSTLSRLLKSVADRISNTPAVPTPQEIQAKIDFVMPCSLCGQPAVWAVPGYNAYGEFGRALLRCDKCVHFATGRRRLVDPRHETP